MTIVDDARVSPLKFILSQLGTTFTLQPVDTTGVIGGQATFTADFTVNPAFGSVIILNWQENPSASAPVWRNLRETAGIYEGVATKTLTIKAIDNFLPSFPNRQFRLAVSFAGTAPTFSDPAQLLVTNYLIQPGPLCLLGAFIGSGSMGGLINAPLGSFAGPYTFKWDYVSGSVIFSPGDDTDRDPLFDIQPPSTPNGVYQAIWTATVSKVPISIVSDPIFLNVIINPDSFIPLSGSPDLILTRNSDLSITASLPPFPPGERDPPAVDLYFVGPWTAMGSGTTRFPAAGAITIVSPGNAETEIRFAGPVAGGVGAALFVACLAYSKSIGGNVFAVFSANFMDWGDGPT